MKKFWFKKAIGFTLFGIVIAALLSFIVKIISFWQALGILVLSKILFGGFHKNCGPHHHPWRQELREKWAKMNPEEREEFKQQMRGKCSRWRRNEPL
jgi:hypothetical protein